MQPRNVIKVTFNGLAFFFLLMAFQLDRSVSTDPFLNAFFMALIYGPVVIAGLFIVGSVLIGNMFASKRAVSDLVSCAVGLLCMGVGLFILFPQIFDPIAILL